MALIKRWTAYAVIAICLLVLYYHVSPLGRHFAPESSAGKGVVDLTGGVQEAAKGVGTQSPVTPPTLPQVGGTKQQDAGQNVLKWNNYKMHYPVKSHIPMPTGKPVKLPEVQFDFRTEGDIEQSLRTKRQGEVKAAFQRAWAAYKKHAWLKDEVTPITGSYSNGFGGWAATLIDTLDTLWIMDMKDDFHEAVAALDEINWKESTLDTINVFETTIRHLGGFLAAYDLSGEKVLLDRALDVAEMLYAAFDTPNRLPITRWSPAKATKGTKQEADETVLLAEIGSLTMEFTRLAQVTGDGKWYDAVARITELFAKQQMKTHLPGMWPILVNAKKQDFTEDTGFTLAAMADSMYEYLPKMYALLGGQEPLYKQMYDKSMEAAISHSMFRPMTEDNADILMTGFVRSDNLKTSVTPEVQHLSCFAGGMFALGGKLFRNQEHVDVGRKLTDGCIWAYKVFPIGIMPEKALLYPCPSIKGCNYDESKLTAEIARRADEEAKSIENKAKEDGQPIKVQNPMQDYLNKNRMPKPFTQISDTRYILRPEAIESVFILYRITGAQALQAAAWDMWTAIDTHTKTDIANAAIADVTVPKDQKPPLHDSMESFWMAETLKYFYLIFSEPNVISLDEWVFNTEAHPFRRPKA